MSRFPGPTNSVPARCILGFLLLLTPLGLRAQSVPTKPPATAVLRGIVVGSAGLPVSGATVHLESPPSGILTALTDSAGAYRFPSLPAGEYILRAKMPNGAEKTIGPFALAKNESKIINLTLEFAQAPAQQNSTTARPEFSDEPHFTVAGVTDTTNLGGHGSDVIVRNREALAKAAAALPNSTASPKPPIPPNAAVEKSLGETLQGQPADANANFRLGKLLVDEGKAENALLYLERASQLNPASYENNYELALALARTNDYAGARKRVQSLLKNEKAGQENAEPHHLLAEIYEKLNDPLQAVKQYQRAAELSPTEPYLFDWGAELLVHHAAEPALLVFTKGNRLFPHSARMLAGMGASWYALGSYDQAVRSLGEAADLNPDEPDPYIFLGKIQAVESEPSNEITQRLAQFVRLHPENALANYYYAVCLWKSRKSPEDAEAFARAQSFLEKAVQLDKTLGLAYLQLGILYSEQKDLPNAVAAYQHAIDATPDLQEAHYRLAQVFRHQGESSKAQAELERYRRISTEKAAEIERQRHQVQQFVYHLGDQPAAHPQ